MFTLARRFVIVGLLVAGTAAVSLCPAAWRHAIVETTLPGLIGQDGAEQTREPTSQQHAAEARPVLGTSGQRLVAWVLFVLLVPVVTAPVAMGILRRESNAANFLLLIGYTCLDVAAAYVAGSPRLNGLISGLTTLIALVLLFAYNVWICAFLAKLQK